MTFLIADDNPSLRKVICSILHSPGDSFFECSDGLEAVSDFQKYHPDFVIMDIEMNKMDGITAAKEILRDFPGANIIILTQYDDDFLREAALKSGVKSYFLKDNLVLLRGFIIQQISSEKFNLK